MLLLSFDASALIQAAGETDVMTAIKTGSHQGARALLSICRFVVVLAFFSTNGGHHLARFENNLFHS
jgi:hypothetical protein